jgi:hypothetical protein
VARCDDCVHTTVEPATDSYDEVLREVARADGMVGVDASPLSILDYVLIEEGYQPPLLTLSNRPNTTDYGRALVPSQTRSHRTHRRASGGAGTVLTDRCRVTRGSSQGAELRL